VVAGMMVFIKDDSPDDMVGISEVQIVRGAQATMWQTACDVCGWQQTWHWYRNAKENAEVHRKMHDTIPEDEWP
jgi:hypothetical protein